MIRPLPGTSTSTNAERKLGGFGTFVRNADDDAATGDAGMNGLKGSRALANQTVDGL
jgi:hypothetical protein